MPTKREEEAAKATAGDEAPAVAEEPTPSTGDEDDSRQLPEADWYPHPQNPSEEFYWDGSDWTGASRKTNQPSVNEARSDIENAARRMNWRLGSRREIKKLPQYLHDGEVVSEMACGSYGGGTGLLVLTDERLFFLRDGWTGAAHEDFPLERVTTVGFSSSFGTGAISIHASGNTREITSVISADGKRLTAAARKVAGKSSAVPAAPVPQSHSQVGPAVDPIDQLQRLGDLKDQGILTPEEFEEKKKTLLDRL
jgi:hypothetical protein